MITLRSPSSAFHSHPSQFTALDPTDKWLSDRLQHPESQTSRPTSLPWMRIPRTSSPWWTAALRQTRLPPFRSYALRYTRLARPEVAAGRDSCCRRGPHSSFTGRQRRPGSHPSAVSSPSTLYSGDSPARPSGKGSYRIVKASNQGAGERVFRSHEKDTGPQ
ncbi:hypothetical protein BD626DRAFT_175541 [Schizophyllum amplum]|uniref:Uncharacterized protein n=1 Tax=Schizophyllum amplum TaxID=97359 RepID=A0A550C2S1_9AGAR|nr:hypothetical protein BD626DRAFT_175541 [Auriculariopsis ampla]